MPTFVCTTLVEDTCTEWSEQVGLFPALTAEQGLTIGSQIVLCMATAWAFRTLIRFIFNR